MKILYLLPPSEGKKSTSPHSALSKGEIKETLSFPFEKPIEIAISATHKDLKCSGQRYQEGIELNKNIADSEKIYAISRYSGVMYTAIDYEGMEKAGKKYFEDHFLILSGMYGILKATDKIGNYKLPIETKGLVGFWDTKITDTLNHLQADIIVDLLPLSYKKMIQWKNIEAKIFSVAFIHKQKKLTHGVKKVKGQWIHALCETGGRDIVHLRDKQEKVLEIEIEI